MCAEVVALEPAEVAEENQSGRVMLGRRIRELRLAQGLSQRALTHLIGLSAHSNLADYETGRRLPPQDIVSSCERVLGLQDGELLGLRRAALVESATAHAPVVTTAEPIPRGRDRARRRWTFTAGGAVLLALITVVYTSHDTVQRPQATTGPGRPVPVVEPPGGHDGVSACDDTTTILGSTPISAPKPFYTGGALHPAGTPLGTISLRYSPGCSLGWARFIPGTALDQSTGSLVLEVHRPSDGAITKTRMTLIAGAESDPLLTTPGCVYAQATVTFTRDDSATARTGCLRQ
jgi:transcriptional regulator with XRE-family HTH domain